MEILRVDNLKKVYGTINKTIALENVSFSVDRGEFVAIMGESGAGKTTLLNVLATLDRPSGGSVVINGQDLSKISHKSVTAFRRNELGFVFQDFNLLERFSNKDNILLPLVLSNYKYAEMNNRLYKVAEILGISDFLEKYPYEISGGQKQRIAIARALITDPALILADEPTGALDTKNANNLMNLFQKINSMGQTIIMVTHSVLAASKAKRVIFIKDGILFNEIYRGSENDEEYINRINSALILSSKKELNYE